MVSKRFEWTDRQCNRWCKVHNWYSFDLDMQVPYPETKNIQTSTHGWLRIEVAVGPPAYYPKRPTPGQLAAMQMVCPHDPPQLTCQTCHRHDFYPRVIV